MLQLPQPPGTMRTWAQSMEEQMESQRERLRSRDSARIAENSGASWRQEGPETGTLTLKYLQTPLVIHVPDYTMTAADGSDVPTMTQGLVTAYLLTANGTPRAGDWITFRELPNGLFYHLAFEGYTGGVLVRKLGDDLDAFRRGAKTAGGGILTGFGDAAYEFHVMPGIWLAIVYWLGDEEDGFPSRAQVLFDRAARHYLVTDGLAIISSHLVRQIIHAAGK